MLNLEHENRRIDVFNMLLLLYDFLKWHHIREILGYGDCYFDNLTIILKLSKKGTKDKVWLDDYGEKIGQRQPLY